jgi:hypothetical protein
MTGTFGTGPKRFALDGLDFCADGCRLERFFSCLLVAVHFVKDGLREGLQKFFAGEALPADGELGFAFGGVTVVVGDRRQKLSPYGRFLCRDCCGVN